MRACVTRAPPVANHPAWLTLPTQYGTAMRRILFCDANYVASCDEHSMRLWDTTQLSRSALSASDGAAGATSPVTLLSSSEPGVPINDIGCLGGGLFVLAVEDPAIRAYYCPTVGPAPKWCAFLDALTEEMDEVQERTVYDDYKVRGARHRCPWGWPWADGQSGPLGHDAVRSS